MSSDDLKKRILKSEAIASLASEQQVTALLRELYWAISHGSFFNDPITNKLREIDVIARRSWKRGSGDEQLRSYLNLIIEVKTMRGYHLVFAPLPDSERGVIVEREWLG